MSERILCRLGAVTVLVVGAVHFELWAWHGYRNVHVIGPLFLLNALGAVGLSLVLALRGGPLAELAGVVFAASTLGAFLLSLYNGLFGFVETPHGAPQTVSLVAEVAAIVLLSAALALRSFGGPGWERPAEARPAASGTPAARGHP